MNPNQAVWMLTVIALGWCSGCGQAASRSAAVYPLDGQLYYQGKPAVGALITFHPLDGEQHQQLTCEVRTDGHFVATQSDGALGLPEGNYALTLEWPAGAADRFAGKYSTPSSPLRTVKVESTVNLLPPIQLK